MCVYTYAYKHTSMDIYKHIDSINRHRDSIVSSFPKKKKGLFQHHSSKASILWCSAFFTVQLSHPSMTTGKTIALTRRTFVDKVMSLLFNMLSRLVITFLSRSKCLLISWVQSPSAVILEPRKIKSDTVSTVSPFKIENRQKNI